MTYPSISDMIKNNRTVAILVVLAVVVGWFLLSSNRAPTEQQILSSERVVTLATVGELSEQVSPLPLLGTVTSRSEATVRAESSGKLTVYKNLGDYVSAGSVIAEFENSAERAGLLSAEGSYAAAEAGISSAQTGTSIATINTDSSVLSLESAKTQALNMIQSTYATLDDVVRTKTDSMFSNPQTRDAKFVVFVSDARLLTILEDAHLQIESLLSARAIRNQMLTTNSDLVVELATIELETNQVKSYLDELSSALSLAIPDGVSSRTTIEGYKTVTGIARSTVSGTLSALSGSKSLLNASIAGNKVAGQSLAQSLEGSSALAAAGVTSAKGALQAAQARLDKTIVRSPIFGTINSLAVSTGDFVSPYSEIAVVSNNGTLEVIAYATEEDSRALQVGSKVVIEGTVTGVITRIAGALDPKTKKIEVRIGITANAGSLINGQTVHVTATRKLSSLTDKHAVIQIPLSALKITPTGSVVFSVSASSTLIAHAIKEGALLGDRITIVDGLTKDMVIVVDARGLKDGGTVTVAQQ